MAFPILPMQLRSFDPMDYTAPHGEQSLWLTNKVLILRSPFVEIKEIISAIADYLCHTDFGLSAIGFLGFNRMSKRIFDYA
jgi:hypothetical protein